MRTFKQGYKIRCTLCHHHISWFKRVHIFEVTAILADADFNGPHSNNPYCMCDGIAYMSGCHTNSFFSDLQNVKIS